MGERLNGIQEVGGSTPLGSTNEIKSLTSPQRRQQSQQALGRGSQGELQIVDLDLGAVQQWMDAARSAIGLGREAAERAFDEAEKAAKLADAQLAQALGYKLCRHRFPPDVMLERFDEEADVRGYWACPECGREDPPEQERRALPHRITPTSW